MKLVFSCILLITPPCAGASLCEREDLVAACSEVHATVLDVEAGQWSQSSVAQKAVHSVDLREGARLLLCDQPRLGGTCIRRSQREVEANHNIYGLGGPVRSAEVTTDSPFWGSAAYIASYPNDRQGLEWGNDEAQGVAHDDTHWFVSERAHITRVPLDADLGSNGSDDKVVGLPSGCRHFGDPVYSYSDELLYVPLEQCALGSGTVRRIVAYDGDLVVRRSATLASAAHAAWIAAHPRSGFLFTAGSFSDVHTLDVYGQDFADGEVIRPMYSVHLVDRSGATIVIRRVQGGEFSDTGRLYLTSDDHASGRGGVYVFDVQGRTATLITRLGPNGLTACQEVEGITVWDADGEGVPRIGGQIHWLLYSQNGSGCGDSNIWFKHLRVSQPDRL